MCEDALDADAMADKLDELYAKIERLENIIKMAFDLLKRMDGCGHHTQEIMADNFVCPICKQYHDDCSMIQHNDDCQFKQVMTALKDFQ